MKDRLGRVGKPGSQQGRPAVPPCPCLAFLKCYSLSSFLCSLHAKPGKKHALNNSRHVPQGEGLHARITREKSPVPSGGCGTGTALCPREPLRLARASELEFGVWV